MSSEKGKLSLATKQASSPLRNVVNAKKTVIPKGKAVQKKVEITPSSKQEKATSSGKPEKTAKRAPAQSTGKPVQKRSLFAPKPKNIHPELFEGQPSSECVDSDDEYGLDSRSELGDYDLFQYGSCNED